MKTLIYNIGTLAGILPEGVLKLEGEQMNEVKCIENAYLVIEDGVITDFGQANSECIISSEDEKSAYINRYAAGEGAALHTGLEYDGITLSWSDLGNTSLLPAGHHKWQS